MKKAVGLGLEGRAGSGEPAGVVPVPLRFADPGGRNARTGAPLAKPSVCIASELPERQQVGERVPQPEGLTRDPLSCQHHPWSWKWHGEFSGEKRKQGLLSSHSCSLRHTPWIPGEM